MLSLALQMSLAHGAQRPIGAHQQSERTSQAPLETREDAFTGGTSVLNLPCQKERNSCHLKTEIKFL